MTTKTLTGTYSAGYTLSAAFAELIVTPTANVGGAGVRANALATIENEGNVLAGAGAAGGSGHYLGGAGNIGVLLEAGGRLVNSGALSGGQGGAGGYDTVAGSGYSGGAGGVGALVLATSAVVDHATIMGGAGGAGGNGNYSVRSEGGSGGEGGDGLVLKGGGSLAIGRNDMVVGGQGGAEGASYTYRTSAHAGVGGNAVDLQGAETISNFGTILAGAGGAGGNGFAPQTGAAGGVGLVDVSAGASLTNTGLVEGGAGGAGSYGGGGGAGGAGAQLVGAGQIANAGTILAGAGGAGGNAFGGFGGDGGSGGVGVYLQGGGTLSNSGLIEGGAGGRRGYGDFGNGSSGGSGDGVYMKAGGVVSNLGTIEGGPDGVLMLAGGALTNGSVNDQTAAIEGGFGVAILNGAAGVTNFGTIAASVFGVTLDAGEVVNAGTISGGIAAVFLQGSGSLNNSGVIAGGDGANGSDGVYRYTADQLMPAVYYGPLPGVGGGDGVDMSAGGAVTNAGVVAGGAGGAGGNGIVSRPYGFRFPGAYPATGGAGGAGGAGASLSGPVALANSGSIGGGAGGAGGAGSYYPTLPTYTAGDAGGAGGRGGAGVVLAGVGTLSNMGTLTGANGGAGGAGGVGVLHDYQGGSGGNGGAGGAGGDGVDLLAGGVLDNSGVIEAGAGSLGGAGAAGYGGGASGTAGANGAAGDGVALSAGGVVTNGGSLNAAALISGGIGVYAQGAGATVINYGTIVGSANAVKLASAGDVLIAESGARFVGVIAGGGGTFDLAGGAGTITGLGGAGVVTGTDQASFGGFGAYIVGAGGNWTLAGFDAVAKDQSLTVNGDLAVTGTLSLAATRGTLAAGSGGLVVFSGAGEALAGTITGAGSVDFTGGSVKFNGSTLSAAHMTISGASVTLAATVTNTGTVSVTTPSLLIAVGGATLAGGTWALTDSAANKITGLAAGDILNNVNATISGAGMLGAGQMSLINRSDAVIDGNGQNALIIDTGASQIATSGIIEATGAGGVTIQSAVLNGGKLEAAGGTLTVNGAVTGSHGMGVIASGALVFSSTFAENVTFSGTAGMLGLARSQTYTGAITGFSTTGGTSLDLGDIGFVSSSEATFSGTATGGALTVTDGTHTARVTLLGDYLGSTFVTAGDGHGGSIVTVEPGAVHWLNPAGGGFATAADWSGGTVPGAANVAILDASGQTAYTVTASANTTVAAVQTAANATLQIAAGVFAATAGSGAGANLGAIAVADGGTLSASGTVDNVGVLAMQGVSLAGPHPYLLVGSAGLTLTGGGQVALADALSAPFQPCPPNYSLDRITGVAGATLTNVDNTIAGAGWIGLRQIGLVNEAKGVIDASLVTALVLNPVGTLVNQGLLESTGPGGLYINYTTVDNASGGVIAAAGARLYISFAAIIGGTFTSSGAGFIYSDHGANTLDGATAGAVINKAFFFVSDDSSVTLEGAIDNLNEFEVGTSTGSSSLIVGAGGATLTGGGKVVLGSTNTLTQLTGATAGATLVNVDNTLSGQGQIGAGSLILVNQAGGVIDADYSLALTLDTGANAIANAGLIEATRAGGMIITSAVANSGTLEAAGGTLTANGAVSGPGVGEIASGALIFTSTFAENVTFTGTSGVLGLTMSQSYGGAITGFSTTGRTSLDLGDIGFVSSSEATFSGTATGGVLTVTDGAHTAHITLIGDYLASTFTVSSDGHGGTIVVDPTAPATAHRFIAAAAGLGASGGVAIHAGHVLPPHEPMLASPRAMLA